MRWLCIFFGIMHSALAEPIRVAYWQSDLSRDGPGLLIKDCEKNDEDLLLVFEKIKTISPDVFVLSDVDQDSAGWLGTCITDHINMPNTYSGRTNLGKPSGFDLNQDGRLEAIDKWGYGRFEGQGGMIIFSRNPIRAVANFTDTKWQSIREDIPYYSPKTWDDFPSFLLEHGWYKRMVFLFSPFTSQRPH